jgi:beta-xylosidase
VATPAGAATKPKHRPKPKPKPPLATTSAPRAVTGSSAGVRGRVNPNGHPTTSWFQFGTSKRYGAHTRGRAVGAGRRPRAIAAALAKLAPMTTYHYRLVASHCRGCRGGTAYGRDGTFTTGGYHNPVFPGASIADPSVLTAQGPTDYWAYSTGDRFPILHSSDLVHWTLTTRAFSQKPSWVVPTGDWHPWAPHVVTLHGACPNTTSPQCYVMFYTGLSARFKTNCIAIATSTTPWGPFADQGPLSNGVLDATGRPIGCGDDAGYGMIDPSVFTDPATGAHYLYGSEDVACPESSSICTNQNSVLEPTISVIPLAEDFLSATGPRTPLFTGDPGTWEATNTATARVEGPSMTVHNGTYYLFYSGGNWRSTYGMGYATGQSPTGPFTKSARNPILKQTGRVFSPGGGDAFVRGPHGGTWLVYHGRPSPTAVRTLRVDAVTWQPAPPGPDVPVVAGPTATPQPNLP